MAEIHALSKRYGFHIIEDASHAFGARYRDSTIGDCRYSDITVFSFHPVKILTTAEGGLATTRSAALAQRMGLFRSHGVTRDPALLEQPAQGGWYYEQQCMGFNYRLTDLQAALGCSQLLRVDQWIARRHEIAEVYDRELAPLPLVLPRRSATSRSALHLYPVQLDDARTSYDRRSVFDQLRAAGIGVNVHYIPVHTQPDFRRSALRTASLPVSEAYYARCLSLPMFPALTAPEQGRVIDALRQVLA
jgi:dTDP-4-amino-4,6-dideoxygalactose transaminase